MPFLRPLQTCGTRNHGNWLGQAIHEVGHAFNLQDEYQTDGPDIDYDEDMPNVTNRRDARASIWCDLVSGGVPTDPTVARDQANPFDGTVVGTFEGALYCDEGLYRPSAKCKMREVNRDFCAVCLRTIRTYLTPL